MSLRPYSTRPLRAGLQVLCDLAVLVWVVGWIKVGRALDGVIIAAAHPGYVLQSGAGRVASDLRDAGHGVERVPYIGHPVSEPLISAGNAAGGVSGAGRELGDRITSSAFPVSLALVLITVLPVVLVWLALRSRFAWRAGSTAAVARTPGGDALLALRALANRSPRRLTAISPDPVDAWRREDPEVVRRLADLELRLTGVSR